MDYFDDLESAIENEYPLIYFRKKLESKSESQAQAKSRGLSTNLVE